MNDATDFALLLSRLSDSRDLGLALASTSEVLKQQVYENMSQAAAGLMGDIVREWEAAEPMEEIRRARKTIVGTILRLEREGKIGLGPEAA